MLAVLWASLPFAFLAKRFDWVCDDAYISFRYAKNLANGLGLVYNPGEEPPVEGYTNLLWVLLMAAVESVHADPTIWSRVLSLSCAMLLLLWVARFVQRALDSKLLVLALTTSFLVSLPSLQVWSTSGLAILPVTLCLFGVYDRLLRDPSQATGVREGIQAGLLAACAALLRADALVYLALIFAIAGVTALLERRREYTRVLLWTGGLLALFLGAQFAWRYSYYGDWLPNTARVKAVGGDEIIRAARHERGLGYVVSYFMTVTSMIVVPLASLVLLRRGPHRRFVVHALVVLLGTSAYALRAGGDFMAFGRFFVPAMPFLALLLAALVANLRAAAGWIPATAWTAICVTLSLLPAYDVELFPKSAFTRFHFRWNDRPEKRQSEYRRWVDMNRNANRWVQFGKMLAHVGQEGDSIVVGGVGAIAYYSGLIAYDTHGLTNRHWQEVQPPFQRKSPGHDREMEPSDFLEFDPTYMGVMLVVDAGSDPYEPFGGEAAWPDHPYYPYYGILAVPEVHDLPPDPELPPGKSLLLFRFKDR